MVVAPVPAFSLIWCPSQERLSAELRDWALPGSHYERDHGMDRMSALRKIRNIDYTVIFARNMAAMRRFYGEVMQFPVESELGPQWIAYRVGSALLALTERGLMFNDAPTPTGALSLQMAFRVAPKEVDACGQALRTAGVPIMLPPTDQAWGHRTVFFRDPDGNVLEIYADI
jgi:catechol 2,3-dioxygenase-like lactoylglutathione lyase family enzyme